MAHPLEILSLSPVKFPEAQCKHLGEFMLPKSPAGIPFAKTICSCCVHKQECLEVALDYAKTGPQVEGVWGGTDEKERAEIIRTHQDEFKPQSFYQQRQAVRELLDFGMSEEAIAIKLDIQFDSVMRVSRRMKGLSK